MNKALLRFAMTGTALLSACASAPTTTPQTPTAGSLAIAPLAKEPTAGNAIVASKQKQRPPTPPDAVTQALLPDLDDALINDSLTTNSDYPLPKLNISVHEVAARDFFMGLVVDTKENMLVHPEVKGTISLELKNVTIPQVLDSIQKVYGYDYKKNDVGYIIYPASLQTKTFKIDRLDLLRKGKSNTYISSGQGNHLNTLNKSQPAAASQANTLDIMQQGDNADLLTFGSSIKTSTDTDFWQELEVALHAITSLDKEASVTINKQSGMVIARAKPTQLREIENFINATQQQINRQVILEAKIIEVTLNDSHQDGVNWKSIAREGLQVAPLLSAVGSSASVFTLVSRGGSVRIGDFTALISLLETQGKTKVLSSPRISTLNNQQAIIKVGQDATFVTGISPGIGGGLNSGNVQPAPILSAFFSGIALDVTPQISDNQEVTLHIHPSITRVESLDRKFSIGDNNQESTVPTALSTIRESDSIVKVKDGQIIVLGGLMQESMNEDKEGVSGVSRIPFLGNLFRENKGKTEKSELIILLKAIIIDNDNDWTEEIDGSKQRSQQLDRTPRWQ